MDKIKEFIGTNTLLLDNYGENYADRIIGGDRMVLESNMNNNQRGLFVNTINKILDKDETTDSSNIMTTQQLPTTKEGFKPHRETFKHAETGRVASIISIIIIFVFVSLFMLNFMIINKLNHVNMEQRKIIWMLKSRHHKLM